jgi:hypothetical protein
MWGAHSDERTGLSFTIAAGVASAVILGSESSGTRDHILLSQIRDFPFRRLLRLAGLRWRYSPHLQTGEPLSLSSKSKSKLCYDRRSAGQSVLEQSTHLGLTTRSGLLSDSCGFVDLGRPLSSSFNSLLLLLLGGPHRIHQLHGIYYCVSYMRCAGYTCNTVVTKPVVQQRTPIVFDSVTLGNVFS